MKVSQMKTFLMHALPAGLPVLIKGAPGIGKSDVVQQVAEETSADMILSHPAVADPTDAKGLPWVAEGGDEATFLPFGELAKACKATKRTYWFLDDLGQAPAAVQASFMQLMLARRVNGHVLPDCVTFVAATNRRTDRAGVTGILEPVKSRFASIVELEPDLDEWCVWAFEPKRNIPPELIAFLRFRPEFFCKFEPSADLTNSPMPRTWAHAAKLLNLGLPADVITEVLGGAVGQGAAVELLAFIRLFREMPSIDAILIDPDSVRIPKEPSVLYAVTTALAMKANAKNFGRVARYAERLLSDSKGEFATLLIRDCVRRNQDAVTSTNEFVKLMSGDLGQLVVGTI